MRDPKRCLLALLLLCLLTAGPTEAKEPQHTPYNALLPNPAWAKSDPARLFHAVQVIDAKTRKAIAGATLAGYDEDLRPTALGFDKRLAHATSNAQGIAWVVRSQESLAEVAPARVDHWLVQAQGYAPAYHFGYDPPVVVPLARGADRFEATLVDTLGVPVANAEVQMYCGCPHGPAFAMATTDETGRVRMARCVPEETSLWCVPPRGRVTREWSVDRLSRAEARGQSAVLDPGRTLTGRVVNDGKPVANAVVRIGGSRRPQKDYDWAGYHRGPATATDSDGHFVLRGLHGRGPVVGILATAPDGTRVWRRVPNTPAPDLHIALDVPDLAWTGPTGELTLAIQGAPANALPNAIAVRTDGLHEEMSEEPGFAHTLPVGTWTVWPESSFGAHTFAPATVTIVEGHAAQAQLTLVKSPVAVALGATPWSVNGSVVLTTAHESKIVTYRELLDGTIHVPLTEPVALHDDAWIAQFGEPKDGKRIAQVRATKPSTLDVRGGPTDGAVSIERNGHMLDESMETVDGQPKTWFLGKYVARVEDADNEHLWRVPFEIKKPGGTVVILCTEQNRVPNGRVAFSFDVPDDMQSDDFNVWAKHENGWWELEGAYAPEEDIRGPSWLKLSADGYQPMEGRLEPGKHHWILGEHALVIESFAPDGTRVPSVVMVDGYLHRDYGAKAMRLRGLNADAHHVIVTPLDPTQRGVQFTLTLSEPETKQRVEFTKR